MGLSGLRGGPRPVSADEVRRRLVEVASRRLSFKLEQEQLGDEIRQLMRDADAVGISTSEVARTLGMDRSTLYRVYRHAA